MIDPFIFSVAQKMTWAKQLFYNNYESLSKSIELSKMDELYGDVLWYSYGPEKVLNSFTWYSISWFSENMVLF